jgi:GDP-L-fucose synthase
MNKDSKILVTGCQGMLGWAMVRELDQLGYDNVSCIDRVDYDLLNQRRVWELFEKERPEYVFHIAAKVGGIFANDSQSGAFIYENLMMQCNVIEAARIYNVKKLLFCGSACIYPKDTAQPIKEDSLLTGSLEKTNLGYAIAKISGVVMCQMYRKQYGCNFVSVMPTNIYGRGDNFNSNTAHVVPGLINKFNDAKVNKSLSVEVWGTGEASREFIYVDDLANGLVFVMNNYDDSEVINIGSGDIIKIKDVVQTIKDVVRYNGDVVYNGVLEGVKDRSLDISKITALGWQPKTKFEDGVKVVYDWYLNNYTFLRK